MEGVRGAAVETAIVAVVSHALSRRPMDMARARTPKYELVSTIASCRAVRSYIESMVEINSYFGVRARAISIGRLDSAWDTACNISSVSPPVCARDTHLISFHLQLN